MKYTMRPISDRTAFTGRHEPTPFRATWSNTMKLLSRELVHLDATTAVIEVDVIEGHIRIDGLLRADAKVASPAVRIAFESRHGSLTYATDRYVGRYSNGPKDWQENVRAIALGLEALRRVDRYGVTKRGEQYAGWKAIGTGSTTVGSTGMSEREAEKVLGLWAGEDVWLTEENPKILRRARAAAHPDRHHGDQTAWDQVEQAARVLQVLS